MGSKGPKPLDDEQQRQLRSAFYDLQAQVRQAQTTCQEISRILKGEATRPRGAVRVVNDEHAAYEDEDIELYKGPIEAGMHFIWEKDNPRAWTHVVVTRVEDVPNDDRAIWTKRADGRIIGTGDMGRALYEVWNDESRCREAFTPCNDHGTATV